MSQSIAKLPPQTAHPGCPALKKAAFQMGLLKTDPRESCKIMGKNIPDETPELGERIVALSPTIIKRLSSAISGKRDGFSMRAPSDFCYIYNTNQIGHNLVVKVNDSRFTTAHFVFHKKDGSKDVVTKGLGDCGAGQRVARVGLDEKMQNTRFIEVYVESNPSNS